MTAGQHIYKTVIRASILAFFAAGVSAQAAGSPIRINEIMYDPPQQASGANLTWIELYNQSPSMISIVGGAGQGAWTVQDQYGSHYFAAQPFTGSMMIPSGSYAVLADDPQAFIKAYPLFQGTTINAPLSLPTTQGIVSIKDGSGQVVAKASWNAVQGAAGNGKTLEFSSGDGAFRESMAAGGSPGMKNSVEGLLLGPVTPLPSPMPQASSTQKPSATPGTQQDSGLFPVVNEIYSNPLPNQSAWIELKNETSQPINLDGWSLHIGSQQNLIALNGVMTPGALILISGSGWGFSMNPQSDSVEIVDPRKTVVFKVSYTSALPQGWSANRITNGSWQASSKPTPGAPNTIKLPSAQPVVIPVSETIPPAGANAYEPPSSPATGRFSDPSLVALGFALGAGIAGAIAFAIVKRRFLY